MTIVQSVVLGIIQGLTEFLPISSTAHLKVIPALLGWANQDGSDFPGAAFTAVIQWGTLLAALVYFRRDIARITVGVVGGLLRGRPLGSPEARLGWMIAAATIPIVACGVIFKEAIETTLRSLYVISAALILLALLLTAAEVFARRRQRRGAPVWTLDTVSWDRALWVGLAQAVALIPGSSRSGVTITAGLFAGLSRAEAARFSFLLSLPSVFAAGVYELYKERHVLLASEESTTNLVVATVVSGVVGYLAIWFLLSYLKTRTALIFVVYRLLLGVLLLALLAANVLKP